MKTNKKISLTTIIFFIVAFLFLAIGLGSLGSVYRTGKAYELRFRSPTDGKDPAITFELRNPSSVEAGKTVTEYYRLTNVYINIAAVYNGEKESAKLTLSRGASTSASAFSYKAEIGNVAYELKNETDKDGKPVEDKTFLGAVGNWSEPFDLSVTNPRDLRVSTYRYYKLTSGSCNMLINEIVFYGEKLKSASGEEGTGEFGVIPAKIYSAPPMSGDDNEQALARAGALLDAQFKPVTAQSSFFRLGKEETYSMLTAKEMCMGNVYYKTGSGANANVYNGDRVYNSLGSSILTLGVLMFGDSPFGLRFFPMLASFGILVMGYLFAKQLTKSEKAGLIFAILYALSGFTLALGHLGTPLAVGMFFFMCALYFVYSFYNKGIRTVGARGVLPLILSGVFGAAAICVNGAYTVASLALVGLFVAGMVRQNKVRRIVLDEAIAAAEEREAQEKGRKSAFNENGAETSHEPSEEKKRVIEIAQEYRWKNAAAPAAFFTAFVIGAMLLSLIFVLPGYVAYVKLFDNVASPSKSVFAIMAQLFTGGFTGASGAMSAFHPFYRIFTGTGSMYAVTAAVCNTAALLAGLLGVAYAVYKIVLVLRKKIEGRDARVALRRALIPLGLIVTGVVCACFSGGALAFVGLGYIGLFMLASECARDLTENGGKLQKPAKIVMWVLFGLLCAVFLLFAVFTFSVPLPATFLSSIL